MIKISVLYPKEEGKTFNMTYYCEKHMPMVQQLLGPACLKIAVEEGIAGMAPGSSPTYVAMGHLFFNSLADFQSSFSSNAEPILGDVANYTDISYIVQISEVKIGT
jgi:uncharacterized protein (TIGR02118 family)